MPSLQALRDFKASFHNIGGEISARAEENIPFEDMELPDREPAVQTEGPGAPETSAAGPDLAGDFSFDGLNDSALDLGEIPGADFPAGDAPAGEAPPGDDADLLALLDTIPDDLGQAETPAEPAGPEAAADLPGADDFSMPGLDLGGEAPADGLDGAEDLLGSFDEPGAGAAGESPDEAADLPGADDFSMPGLDLGGEAPADGFGGTEDLLAGLDLGGELDAGSPADSFDRFDLGGDGPGADFGGTGEAVPGAEPEGMEEFSLPGIDDVLAGSAAGIGGRTRAAAAGSRGGPEEIEEIQLSDEELARFQKTLAGYPLNLRIACEELIAEQAVAPELMSKLIKLLIQGATARETASLAGKILGRTIHIPRGFEKSTGEALETEQGSFAYIFVHNFLPVLRLFFMIAIAAASLFYLIYEFVYTPMRAENIYRLGYERISAGEYQRANDRFSQAFNIHRNKKWFYRYAEAFRDEDQYLYAEEKYDELLRFYPRDKKGVLDYAAMETGYLRNYAKADELLRWNLLDYAPNDKEGLLALGDNSLAWGETDKSKYEDARAAYARLLETYGWTDPVVERMMLYFIRTDNLKEVLPLQAYFTDNKRRKISAPSLAELGGYLLDKQLEEVRGVPNEYVEQIEGIRDLLIRAAKADPSLPESHYHLARYYHSLNSAEDEKSVLEMAIRAFDSSREGSIRRISYRIDAQERYADILINNRDFFGAEEQLVKGAGIYENALSRDLFKAPVPRFGRLYASLGDLEYFTKAGDMEMAIRYYRRSEQQGWAPPEMLYRLGSAHYYREEWRDALERFFTASADLPLNRRLLYALGNASYQRGDYFAAQGYYNRLLDILETQRARLPLLLPNDQPEFIELAERIMFARNNMGAVYEALMEQTGDSRYRSRALALYSESARAWDSLTRNPQSMVRYLPAPGLSGPGANLPYLNSRNLLYPEPGFERLIFPRIDKDVLEPSNWEHLVPPSPLLSPQ